MAAGSSSTKRFNVEPFYDLSVPFLSFFLFIRSFFFFFFPFFFFPLTFPLSYHSLSIFIPTSLACIPPYDSICTTQLSGSSVWKRSTEKHYWSPPRATTIRHFRCISWKWFLWGARGFPNDSRPSRGECMWKYDGNHARYFSATIGRDCKELYIKFYMITHLPVPFIFKVENDISKSNQAILIFTICHN